MTSALPSVSLYEVMRYVHVRLYETCINISELYANWPCRLKELQQRCTKEMDAYAGCMYYYTNEFELCRKEQKEFEKACPFD